MENVIEEKVIEKKVKVLTSETFQILRIIDKLGIRKDLIKLFKELMGIEGKASKYQKELLEIAQEKYKGDIKKAVIKNQDLALKLDNATEERNSLGLEGMFIVIENIPKAEQEIKGIISKVHKMSDEEVEGLEAFDLVEKIKEIVMSESVLKLFTSVAKLKI